VNRATALLLLLTLLAELAGLADGCGPPPRRGLYTALKFTYYEGMLEPHAPQLLADRFDVVYPELGVFDPVRRGFTDFIRSFQVVLGGDEAGNGPLTAALATLPLRLQKTFGPQVRRVAWIYLNRQPRPDDGPGGELSAVARRSPTFELRDPVHRRALIDAVRLLEQLGFEGVQLDLEPFPEEDVPAMIGLLEALDTATGPGFIRSVFTPKYVRPGLREVHPGFVWHTVAPFKALAARCDQLVIPLYDYGAMGRDDAAYRARVGEVAADLLPVLEPRERVWLGLPAYHVTAQHGSSETMAHVRTALEEAGRMPAGLAVFEFTGEAGDYLPAAGGAPAAR
jgi:hypothetical protein